MKTGTEESLLILYHQKKLDKNNQRADKIRILTSFIFYICHQASYCIAETVSVEMRERESNKKRNYLYHGRDQKEVLENSKPKKREVDR